MMTDDDCITANTTITTLDTLLGYDLEGNCGRLKIFEKIGL